MSKRILCSERSHRTRDVGVRGGGSIKHFLDSDLFGKKSEAILVRALRLHGASRALIMPLRDDFSRVEFHEHGPVGFEFFDGDG